MACACFLRWLWLLWLFFLLCGALPDFFFPGCVLYEIYRVRYNFVIEIPLTHSKTSCSAASVYVRYSLSNGFSLD